MLLQLSINTDLQQMANSTCLILEYSLHLLSVRLGWQEMERRPYTGVLTSVSVGGLIKHQHRVLHLQNKQRIEPALAILTKYTKHYVWGGFRYVSHSCSLNSI